MSEITDTFTELLFGEGFIIGFLVILSICLLVAFKIKYSGGLFAFVLLFLAMEYNDNLAVSSYKMWGVVLCFVGTIFMAGKTIMDVKSG